VPGSCYALEPIDGILQMQRNRLGHGMEPKLLENPVITTIAQRVHKTPAQVALAWAV
jgi:diketogulonate reductase-like aldo/keto reductase